MKKIIMKYAGPILASLALALAGCILAPVDGQTVASTSAVIHFSGYTSNASELVGVELFDGTSWAAFTFTTTGAAPERRHDDTDLYAWSVDASVPPVGWKPGTTGRAAQIRTRVGTSLNTAFTFTSSWLTCLGSNPGIYDFIKNCKSPRSPNAFLYTPDYPAGIDLTITNIRRDAGGVLDVSVRNGGRPGRITKIECHWNGAHIARTVNAAINPVETQVVQDLSLGVNAGQTVSCTVFGLDETGTAESNTSNNTRTQIVL